MITLTLDALHDGHAVDVPARVAVIIGRSGVKGEPAQVARGSSLRWLRRIARYAERRSAGEVTRLPHHQTARQARRLICRCGGVLFQSPEGAKGTERRAGVIYSVDCSLAIGHSQRHSADDRPVCGQTQLAHNCCLMPGKHDLRARPISPDHRSQHERLQKQTAIEPTMLQQGFYRC